MRTHFSKIFLIGLVTLAGFATSAIADSKHALNGTWTMVPARCDFGGEPAIQTGSITINDREHNIYVSRSFSYDSPGQSTSYSFSTDGRLSSSIRDGKSFKSKAKWDDKVLVVTTSGDNINESERFSLMPDGFLMLVVERPGHATKTLYFERQ